MQETNDISRRTVLKGSATTAALLALGGVSAGTAAADIGDGRVLDYHLNNLNYDREKGQIVAGHVHDASPAGNHGTWNGPYDDVLVDGPVGRALVFDGVDDYISVPDSPSLDLQEALSIAFWFRLDGDSDPNDFPRAVSKGQSTTSNGAYGVFLEDANTDANRIGLRFIDTNGTRYDVENTNLPTYNDGEWHHVVATYSNAADMGYLYFDGSEVASRTISGDVKIRETDDELQVGNGNSERPFPGPLDEVRVYNRALTEADVIELYEMRS